MTFLAFFGGFSSGSSSSSLESESAWLSFSACASSSESSASDSSSDEASVLRDVSAATGGGRADTSAGAVSVAFFFLGLVFLAYIDLLSAGSTCEVKETNRSGFCRSCVSSSNLLWRTIVVRLLILGVTFLGTFNSLVILLRKTRQDT